jgi:hypothetical protein
MKKIIVNDKMQKNYVYILSEKPGKNFDKNFKPELTPKDMLELGVFGGKYMTDCLSNFCNGSAKQNYALKNMILNLIFWSKRKSAFIGMAPKRVDTS